MTGNLFCADCGTGALSEHIRSDVSNTMAIGAMHQAYQKLEHTFLLHTRAIDQLSEGITISDPHRPDNPLIYVNDAFLRLTGYEQEEVIGRNARFLQGKETDPAAIAAVRTAIEKREPIIIDIRNYRKNGETFWNNMTINPMFNEACELINFVGIQRDVTRMKQLEEENARLKRRMKEGDAASM